MTETAIDYSKCSLRTLKMMRKHHRAKRADSRHRVLFLKLKGLIANKQKVVYIAQENAFLKRMNKFLDKFVK